MASSELVPQDKVQKTYARLEDGRYVEVEIDISDDELDYWVVETIEESPTPTPKPTPTGPGAPPPITMSSPLVGGGMSDDVLMKIMGMMPQPPEDPRRDVLEQKIQKMLEESKKYPISPGNLKDPVFKARLQSIMTDNKYDRRVPNRKRGKLDMKRLWKAKTGSTSLFTQKEARQGKEYNIMLVVDESGSMKGDKMIQAAQTALFLAKNFENMNINLAILGFNQYLILHKDFTQPIDDYAVLNSQMIDRATRSGSGWNNDYDALHRGYRLLTRQKTEHSKNILILISDGEPASWSGTMPKGYYDPSPLQAHEKNKKHHLHALVHKYSDDISSFAIGIFSDSWQVPDHIRANDLAQLKPLILNILRKKIQRG